MVDLSDAHIWSVNPDFCTPSLRIPLHPCRR